MFLMGDKKIRSVAYTQDITPISHKWREHNAMDFTRYTLGRNIQTVRMSRNMTQMQVVEKMQLIGSSISRSTYANIETGRRNIKASDLRALREVLNVDYSEFFKD